MQAKDIAELLNEPACEHNKKSKSGCAKPKPGATAGGCSFDGAQIALLPIADVAHIVHGPIACAGSSWDNRGTRSSGPTLYKIGMTTDLTEQDVVMGRSEKRLFHSIKQAIDSYQPAAVGAGQGRAPARHDAAADRLSHPDPEDQGAADLMRTFVPCKGKTACRDDGETCLTCGRSFAEITRTRELIDALADFACAQAYDNVDEFAAYVARKMEKKVRHRRQARGDTD